MSDLLYCVAIGVHEANLYSVVYAGFLLKRCTAYPCWKSASYYITFGVVGALFAVLKPLFTDQVLFLLQTIIEKALL